MVFRASQMRSLDDAIEAGAGVGFMTQWAGQINPNLVQMIDNQPEWDTTLWIVTHVDLHRTAKVQAFFRLLKDRIGDLVGGTTTR